MNQPQIFTSSWSTKLPTTHLRIGISRGTPRGYPAGYRKLPILNPGPWFNSVTAEVYRERYFEQLAALDPAKVVKTITDMAKERSHTAAVLVCYEDPHKDADWCHRGMVSAWLHDAIGLEVPEFSLENCGCGWRHPKLPRQFRAESVPAQPGLPL